MATLFLLSSLCVGGSERKTVRVANALHRRKHRIHLVWLNGPEALRFEIMEGIPAICLDRRGKFSWSALRRLERFVRRHRISRIICINLYPLLYAKALRLVMGNSAPSCVVMVNVTEFESGKEVWQMMLYAPLLRRADEVVFGCDYQLGVWVERYRLPEELCCYIYNGVDSDAFSMHSLDLSSIKHSAAFGLGREDFVVGTIGKLRSEKQQSDLIVAVAKLRARGVRVVALLVGDGEKEAALKKLATEVGVVEYVRFLGALQDVRPALAAMDVFVLTSIAVETFSNAALEAMAMGRPVVLSDVGGAREMVWEGINGLIYPRYDVERLVSILERLAANPPSVRRMGREARRIAVEQFSFSHMVDKYEGLCVDS